MELEQAARVDGYGGFGIFWKIIFPLIKPGAAITAVFCLVWAWNEFFFASLFTRINARVVSLGMPIWHGGGYGRSVGTYDGGIRSFPVTNLTCCLVHAAIYCPRTDLWSSERIGICP